MLGLALPNQGSRVGGTRGWTLWKSQSASPDRHYASEPLILKEPSLSARPHAYVSTDAEAHTES